MTTKRRRQHRQHCIALAAVAVLDAPLLALALPQGAQVVEGQVTIGVPAAGQLGITQGSARAVVDWRSFGIGVNERVSLAQPAGGAALFRVTGGDPSQIFGNLSATGSLFLSNPNGVLFGAGARVDVGSLAATTLGMTNADFMAGRLRLSGASRASVVNQGRIEAAPGGSVVLLGASVSNSGTINAPKGSVALGAGSAATIDVYGNGLLKLNLTDGSEGASVTHSGTAQADGGVVNLATMGRHGGAPAAINVTGLVRAQSLTARDGVIYLSGGTGSQVSVSGTLDVQGSVAGTRGGSIDVTGDRVTLTSTAQLDASGSAGGGVLRVGGDWQGANAAVANARHTVVEAGATLTADATAAGHGGTVVVWADESTRYAGHISARGGALGGDGGRVETSGKAWLEASGSVDAAAPAGSAGQWLLDPTDVTIGTTTAGITQAGGVFNPQTTAAATINVASINTALNAGTSVTVNTASTANGAGNITVASAIAKTAGAGTTTQLTLNAAGSINMTTGSIGVSGVGTGRLGVNLNAGNAVTISSIGTASGDVSIVAPGGLTLGNINTGSTGNLSIDTSAGRVGVSGGAGTVAVGGAMNIAAGGGFVNFTGLTRVSAGTLTVNAQGLDSIAPVVVSGVTTVNAATNGLIQFRDSSSSFGGTVNLSGLRATLFTGSNLRLGTVNVEGNDVNGNAGLRINAGAGNINITGPVRLGGARVNISTSGNLRLGWELRTTAANFFDQRAILLNAGTFTNANAVGSRALSAPNGTWAVYLPTPAGSSFGGLLSDNPAVWNTGGGVAVTEAGNRYVFAQAPSIVVQASNQSKVYGDTAAPVTLTFNNSAPNANLPNYGNVFTDYATLRVTGSATTASVGYAATADAAVSAYAITFDSLAGFTSNLAGYAFVAGPGRVTVTRRPITLLPSAVARPYGNTNPVSAPFTLTAGTLVNGNTITGVSVVSATTLTSPVGTYGLAGFAATFGNGSANNYAITFTTNASGLSIVPRAVSLTPSAVTRAYGDANPPSGTAAVTAGSLANGDTISSVSLGSTATAASNAGAYALTASNALFSSGVASNYTITYVSRPAGLLVTPRPVTLVPGPASRTYGEANPTSSAAVTSAGSLVNGDAATVIVTTPAITASSVGSYALTATAATFSTGLATNYTITLGTNATGLAVTARPITLTPDAVTRQYGNALPARGSAVLTGGTLVGTDAIGDVALSSTATTTSAVGSYTLGSNSAVFGSGSAANYAITYAGRANGLTVTPRPLTLTPDALSRVYGDANPARGTASVTAGSLVGTDAVADLAITAPATATSFVGSYALTGSGAAFRSGSAANYTITYANRANGLTITTRPVTLTQPGFVSRPYGGGGTTFAVSDPVVTAGSLAAGDFVDGYGAIVSGLGNDTPAGTYPNLLSLLVGLSNQARQDVQANYALTLVAAPFIVTPRPLTLTPVQVARTYGEANPAVAAVTSGAGVDFGLVNGDTVSQVALSTAANATSNVGLYATTGSNALFASGVASNYAISYDTNATGLTVTPRALTVTPVAVARVYGDANPLTAGATGNNLVNGDALASVSIGTSATPASNVGSYATDASNALFATGLPGNYTISYASNPAGLAITPRPITLGPSPVSRAYGDANPARGGAAATVGTIVNGDTVASVALSSPALLTSPVGGYDLDASNAVFSVGNASNYAISYVTTPVGLFVNPRPVTLTPDAVSRVYGGINPASGSATVTAGNLVNGDTLGSLSLTSPANTGSNVGTYPLDGANVLFTAGAAGNYTIAYAPLANGLTVTPRALTVTPGAVTRQYGDANPTTASATGNDLVNGDTLAAISITSGATPTSNVGGFATSGSNALFASGLAGNYAIAYADNPSGLTITPRALTLTPEATARAYGDTNPLSFTAFGNVGGLVNGDRVASVTLSTSATPASNVGRYDTTGSNALFASGLATNYTIAYATNPAGLDVTPRALTLTPVATTRLYGDANPLLGTSTANAGELVNGDSVASVSLATPAAATSNVGVYDTTAGNALFATGLASNYAIAYATNALGLAVTPRPLTVTPEAVSRVYGNANPATATARGNNLVNGDALASVSIASVAGVASNVGAYSTSADSALFATGLASNYTIAYTANPLGLAVTARPLTVTPDAVSRLYGESNPATATARGNNLVNGDALASVSIASVAGVASNVGIYSTGADSALFATGLAGNYAITYADNTAGLAVTPRPLTLTPDALSRTYGDANPARGTASGNAGGLVNGDRVASVALASPAVVNSGIGGYDLAASGALFGAGSASNYLLSYAALPSGLLITPRSVDVAALPGQAKVAGRPDPVFAYGIASGSLVAGDAFSGSLTRAQGEALGSYPILQGTLSLGANYTLGYTGAPFTVSSTGALAVVDRSPAVGAPAPAAGDLLAALPPTAAGPATDALATECVRDASLGSGTAGARLVNRGMRLPARVVDACKPAAASGS